MILVSPACDSTCLTLPLGLWSTTYFSVISAVCYIPRRRARRSHTVSRSAFGTARTLEKIGTQPPAVGVLGATPFSRLSRYRFDQVRATPTLYPSEPRRPPTVKQIAPCGARSTTRPWSSLSCEPRSPYIPSVRKYSTRLNAGPFPRRNNFIYRTSYLDTLQSIATAAGSSLSVGFGHAWMSTGRRGATPPVPTCVHPSLHTYRKIQGRNNTEGSGRKLHTNSRYLYAASTKYGTTYHTIFLVNEDYRRKINSAASLHSLGETSPATAVARLW